MIITCSQCQAKFKVAPEQIKETGSKVRCSNCQYVFTVFRPRRQDDDGVLDLPSLAGGLDVDAYLKSDAGGGRTDDYGLGDIFGDRPAPRPDGQDLAEDYEDPEDGLDEFGDIEDDGPHLRAADNQAVSMKERRDRRRQLYSDLEEDGPFGDDDEPDAGFDEEALVDEDGHPPLRRAARSAYGAPAAVEEEAEAGFDDQYDEQYDEQYDDQYGDQAEEEDDQAYADEPEGDYSYESTRLARQVSDLGLSANPVDPDRFIDDAAVEGRSYGAQQEAPTIRAAVTKPESRLPVKLIVGLIILALVLGIGIYFITSRPAPKALSGGEEVGETTDGGEGGETVRNTDAIGAEGITFTRGNQNHYFRDNTKAGNILIITGMVRNSYPHRRNFIRLRGLLLTADGRPQAERYVYAGNIISEEDLVNLPMSDISSRLNIKGGQDGLNMNIEPGQEIPFMLVFDKLPDAMSEYRIDPAGSDPSN